MSELEKGLKEQLESVIKQNQMLLEKHYQQDSKIVKLIEENNYYKNQLQQKENIIKEVGEYIEEHTTYERYGYIDELQLIDLDFSIKDLKQILDKDITKKSDCNYEKVEKENK